jgi:protein TonB
VTAAGLLTLAYISAPPRAAGTATQPVLARVRAGAAALIDSAAQALRSAPPEPAPAPPPAVPAPPSRSARRAAAARVERPAVVPEEAVSLRSVETYATPAEPEIIAPAVTATPDPTVYTSDDADVTPAALLRPHLPSQPPASLPGADVGTLELMVTETGRVAHVKLVSTSSRYQERMLVAAAKTWRFQPAMKNGQPVRFRARIRITV